MEVIRKMAEIGNPNSVSDAGVGALCARTAVLGAYMNVKINCPDIEDRAFVDDKIAAGQRMVEQVNAVEREIVDIVNGKIDG